jgi:polar amino acid transport system ATP-binding protein
MGFARKVADTVAFMDAGLIVEFGPPDRILENPQHERTKSFFSKVL